MNFLNNFFNKIVRLISETGPPHMKMYTVGVFLCGKQLAKGYGYSHQVIFKKIEFFITRLGCRKRCCIKGIT